MTNDDIEQILKVPNKTFEIFQSNLPSDHLLFNFITQKQYYNIQYFARNQIFPSRLASIHEELKII